ncbi:MAG: PaaI family thioesterase [Acidimicrobiia bacterium]|nr:PaaI family thioesterase [Acidimicrobiia bacterium]
MIDPLAPNAHRFAPLPQSKLDTWSRFGNWDDVYFPSLVGLEVEELRTDYARLRLPFRPEITQPAGVVHGGAIATLVDAVVVPAVGTGYDGPMSYVTVNMHIDYLGAVAGVDAVAEGWIERRGRSLVFCRAEVRTRPKGAVAATAALTFMVRPTVAAD